jgi:hypothetical protein
MGEEWKAGEGGREDEQIEFSWAGGRRGMWGG